MYNVYNKIIRPIFRRFKKAEKNRLSGNMDVFSFAEKFKNTLPASLAGRSLDEEHVCLFFLMTQARQVN